MIWSLLYFFLLFLGIGCVVFRIFDLKIDNSFERLFMSIGIGLGTFPLIVCVMHLLHIPFNYLYFIPFMFGIYFLKDMKKFIYKKHDLIVIGLFLIMFCVMFYGNTKYPYLADDDPWGIAIGSKFVSIEKTAWTPEGFYFHYLDPYPPTYSIMLGVLHQTNDSIKTTLKFFNSLLIGLTIIFFYYFSKRFIGNRNVALISTFVLFCLPSFMSHFIWAQTLAIPLMIVAFYCLVRINGPYWEIVAGITMAGVLLTQPSTAVIFIIMVLIYGICTAIMIEENRLARIVKLLIAGGVCFFAAGIYWFNMFLKYGFGGTLKGIGLHATTLGAGDTSGGVIYKLADFIVVPIATKIDQPIGLGIFIFIIVMLFLIMFIVYFKKFIKMRNIVIIMCWLVFTFVGVMGNALPFKLFPHRFWVYFSIPVAILVGEFVYGIFVLLNEKRKYSGYGFIVFIVIGLLVTSAYPKFIVNTSMWPPGTHIVGPEIEGAYNLNILPLNTKVFNYYGERDLWMTGMDKLSLEWEPQIIEFRKGLFNSTLDEVYDFLKENEYEYMYMSGMVYRNFVYWHGENETVNHLNNLGYSLSLNTDKFIKVHETQGTALYKIV